MCRSWKQAATDSYVVAAWAERIGKLNPDNRREIGNARKEHKE